MAYWYSKKPRLTSIVPRPPGLFGLLLTRTAQVSPLSLVFHVGMVTALISGFVLEIMYGTGLSGVFGGGWGWGLVWTHGFLGMITAVGFLGVMARFGANRFFRLASGKMFYVDAAFILIAAGSGIAGFVRVLGIWPAARGWATTIHISSVITWLVVSLWGGGLVAHALGTVVYRFNVKGSRSIAAFQAFNTACARCGKCVEVCPLYDASEGVPEEAPALKVRRYLGQLKKGAPPGKIINMVEDVYVCALCGLCMAVCPYSFPHYDLYTTLLARANELRAEKAQEHG